MLRGRLDHIHQREEYQGGLVGCNTRKEIIFAMHLPSKIFYLYSMQLFLILRQRQPPDHAYYHFKLSLFHPTNDLLA